MGLVNNAFWRLEPEQAMDPADILGSGFLTSPDELIAKIRRRDGIVVASWDESRQVGNVHALGIVQDLKNHSALVDWRRVSFTLRPSGQGAPKWRTLPFFKFATLVADRYGLSDHFRAAFAEEINFRPKPEQSTEEPLTARTHLDQATTLLQDAKSSGPQTNRVSPSGIIFATPERGTFMGNRTSPPRWLICDLHFKRDLKEPRKYTKLFFLDEAVALAAGHRPCNTCRRDRYQAYLSAVNADTAVRGSTELDRQLNAARTAPYRTLPISGLPDGAFVQLGEDDKRLKWSGALHRWTPGGYVDPATAAELRLENAMVLTPEPSLVALRNGYVPAVHASA